MTWSTTPSTPLGSGVRILQLTDTHVPSPGSGTDDALASLERVLGDLAEVPDLDVVLVTGDIADDGSAAGCRVVRDEVVRYAAPRGLGQVFLPGNNDSREGFRAALGSGHLSADGVDIATSQLDGPECAAASEHRGLRIITLDSTVPGQMHGRLGARQLSWLRQTLASPAPNGTVVALHHPPLTLDDSPFLSGVALANPDELADVIEGTDVRAVLTGHFHVQAVGFLGSIPVWVCPAVESRVDLGPPRSTLRFVLDPAVGIINLPAAGRPSFYALHARDRVRQMRSVTLPA
ncbi:MAG TPA: metallophosphoesterase [Actinotalea sp.]|nr:metallophosphoesterase [Actinotalea sp.]